MYVILAINQSDRYNTSYYHCKNKYRSILNTMISETTNGCLDDHNWFINLVDKHIDILHELGFSDKAIAKAKSMPDGIAQMKRLFGFKLEILPTIVNHYYNETIVSWYLSEDYNNQLYELTDQSGIVQLIDYGFDIINSDSVYVVRTGQTKNNVFTEWYNIFESPEKAYDFIEYFKDGEIAPYIYRYNTEPTQILSMMNINTESMESLIEIAKSKNIYLIPQKIYLGENK